MFNDLSHWIWAFNQFKDGGDLREYLARPNPLPEQFSLEHLDQFIEKELQQDADHQQTWWMDFDRAAEAMPIIESDGTEDANDPFRGQLTEDAYRNLSDSRRKNPFINIVSGNVNRKLAMLSNIKPTFYPDITNDVDMEAQETLWEWVKTIKENLDLEQHHDQFKLYGITVGSGVLRFRYGQKWNARDMNMIRRISQKREITLNEFQRFQMMLETHQAEHLHPFSVVNYRGANGSEANSYDAPIHRQVHWFETISVAQAKLEFPEYADQIQPGLAKEHKKVRPFLFESDNTDHGMVDKKITEIKFPVIDEIEMNVRIPGTEETVKRPYSQPRIAIGHIERIEGVGIVKMRFDYYDHAHFELVQWVNFPSSKHSKGIGHIKYGRDPMVLFNILHTRQLEYFGRQIKGGGIYLKDVISEDEIQNMVKGNRWTGVSLQNLPPHLQKQDLSLQDVVQDNRPPTLTSAYPQLMQMEKESADIAMSMPDTLRGVRAGESGVQENILQQQGQSMHNFTEKQLHSADREMGDLVNYNIVQFDGAKTFTFQRTGDDGEKRNFAVNVPVNPYETDEVDEFGRTRIAVDHIKNDIGSVEFVTKIGGKPIIPEEPFERWQFLLQLAQYVIPLVQDPRQRIAVKELLGNEGNMTVINDMIGQMEEYDAEQMKTQAKVAEKEQQREQFEKDREFAINKAEQSQELFRLVSDVVTDLAELEPEKLQMLRQRPDLMKNILSSQLQGTALQQAQQALPGNGQQQQPQQRQQRQQQIPQRGQRQRQQPQQQELPL